MLDFSDGGKHLQTREGNDVRIYTTDAGGVFPVHGAFHDDGVWEIGDWTIAGQWSVDVTGEHVLDLIPKPAPPRTGECWLNVYADAEGELYARCYRYSQQVACSKSSDRIACIRVELIEGRFDL